MNGILIMIVIFFFCYYLLYKVILESNIHYLMWLLLNGFLIIGAGFVLPLSKRVFYMIETAGAAYLFIILLTVVLHLDILEKIRDYFK